MSWIISVFDRVVSALSRVNDESKLCFAAAFGCGSVGLTAWLLGGVVPRSWHLHGLLVVAAFYFVLGLCGLRKRRSDASCAVQLSPVCDRAGGRARVASSCRQDTARCCRSTTRFPHKATAYVRRVRPVRSRTLRRRTNGY